MVARACKPILQRLKQDDLKFNVGLGYIFS